MSLRLAVAAALAAAAAAPAALAGQGASPGALVVGMHLPDPGFQVGAVLGDRITFAAGFEADLARALATRLGVSRKTLVQLDLDRLAAPGPKKWNVALARLQPTTGGGAVYSTPYLRADPVVLARRGLASPAALADLARAQLCTTRGSKGRALITSRIRPAVAPLVARDDTELLRLVRTGRCDAAIREAGDLGVALDGSLARIGKIVGVIETGRAYAVAVPRAGARTVLPKVNAALARLRAGGTLHALAIRWLGFDPNRLRTLA